MDGQPPFRDPRQKVPWLRHCLIAITVLALAFALVVSFGPFYVGDRSWPLEGQHDHVRGFSGSPRRLSRNDGTRYGAGGLHRSRGMLAGQRPGVSDDDTPVSLNENAKDSSKHQSYRV